MKATEYPVMPIDSTLVFYSSKAFKYPLVSLNLYLNFYKY